VGYGPWALRLSPCLPLGGISSACSPSSFHHTKPEIFAARSPGSLHTSSVSVQPLWMTLAASALSCRLPLPSKGASCHPSSRVLGPTNSLHPIASRRARFHSPRSMALVRKYLDFPFAILEIDWIRSVGDVSPFIVAL
jgi:hypothetical protein